LDKEFDQAGKKLLGMWGLPSKVSLSITHPLLDQGKFGMGGQSEEITCFFRGDHHGSKG
jgi:hypothetical protein